ncbi:thiosulfate sulfurtransferase GlpE [Herpetosiphon gulosus]|uniref:Thiosulfate sulfurtransferase GlpE n=2 Tax=Herpetosiphon gulosus TaxID=1973496 RepID=A0ABP9X3K3_9CHLR
MTGSSYSSILLNNGIPGVLVMELSQKRQFKNALYEQFARISRALANPHRLELLDLLTQGERTVEDLANETALSIANASQHLQTLRAAQLVSVRREGLYAYYRLSNPSVQALWLSLRQVGESQLADVQAVVQHFLADRSQYQSISISDLYQRIEQQDVVLLDVRPSNEFAAAHLPQARSIPITELSQRLAELAPDQPIVVYCRGPYCLFADEAVTTLSQRGFEVYRLDGGIIEWQAHGFALAQEAAK